MNVVYIGTEINKACMECFRTREYFYCDVRRLLHQLHIPPHEQLILMNMASEKKMNCESFKNILLQVDGII
jgi:hypothetical protein